jgi:signal transduction histidine kinase
MSPTHPPGFYDDPTVAATTRAQPAVHIVRPLGARWLRDFAFHAAGLVTSVVGFTIWVTAVGVSVSMAITIVGLIVALGSFYAFRWFARIERRRALLVLDEGIPEHYRRAAPGSGWWERLRTAAQDPATWKDFAWTGICGVLGFTISLVALTLWAVVLALVSVPLWYWATDPATVVGPFEVRSLPVALLVAAIGLALAPLCGWAVSGLTRLELAAMVPLLRPSREEQLAERVEVLTSTRAGAVDAQAAELQRIERDLHDGAQARLVALAMNLGMAEEKFETDPEQARELLAEARGEAKTALQELRDLARGIHPPILTDRGLEAAVMALAARSPLSVTVEAELPERLPPAIEAAAYFVVAEALANATKHSGAARVLVRLRHGGGLLDVEVTDDGAGGANPLGDGLVGLRRRVEALDGTLTVVSPAGSGTTLHAQVPCTP